MLEHLIGSKTRLKLLQFFFRFPDRSFYLRELCRLLGAQLNAVRREIANLATLGIIAQVPAGSSKIEEIGTERSKYYKLQNGFLLFAELKALLMKSEALEEQRFVEDIQKKGGDIKLLLLTGFFAGDAEAETDLLIVGRIKLLILARLLREFEKKIGRQLRYTIMDEKEFSERYEIGDRFLYNIFESKHIAAVDEMARGKQKKA